MNRAEISADDVVEKVASNMIAALEGCKDGYTRRRVLSGVLGRRLMPLFDYDDVAFPAPGKNQLIANMVDGYISAQVCPRISMCLDLAWDHQEDVKAGYGDLDFYFTRHLLNDKVRVSLINDAVTCSDDDQFIIIEVLEYGRVHIRSIVDAEKSDYPGSEYPERLSLAFYEDRAFIMEHVEEWRWTNKGGVYGDIRDNGYVLSYNWPGQPNRSLYYLRKIDHVVHLLGWMAEEIEEQQKSGRAWTPDSSPSPSIP